MCLPPLLLADAAGISQLVLYDQLGGGDSDWPGDTFAWDVPRFVTELETVRTKLDLGSQ